MKKIAIVTITDMANIGNRLQNYALQKEINDAGYYCETILRYPLSDEKSISYVLKKRILNWLKWVLCFAKSNKRMRQYNFYRFNKNIKFSNLHIYKGTDYTKLSKKYDIFVCGSDQIWNPNFLIYGKDFSYNFLGFVPDNKRIAYAPSFGVSQLTEDQAVLIKSLLIDFSKISVRERAGSEIIYNLTKKEVPVVLDPTLLLSCEEWEQVENKPKNFPNTEYALLYFLGTITPEYERLIAKLKEEYSLVVVNILDETSNAYSAGPSEFLYYIQHAKIILTDSFHASVFSTIFERPFIILRREDHKKDMNSRLENLVQILNLDGHEYRSDIDLKKIMNYDFSKVRDAIKLQKEYSIEFLHNALFDNL